LLGFDPAGTDLVLWTVRAFLVGLVGHSLLEVSARAFYARQNAKTPLLASAAASITFLVLAIPLSRSLGAPGIGLANSLAYTAETLLLFFLLYRVMPFHPKLIGTLLRAGGASLVGLGISLGLQQIIGAPQSILAGVGAASLIIFIAGAQIIPWQLPEIRDLLKI
jgi:putative peptidoglycan lipid II flippase